MTATARITASAVVLASMVAAGALAFPNIARASAGSPQSCTIGSTCTIGEFVYDDEYTPVTSATCTVTSRYPDGSLYLNSQAMTGAADGWYAYSFTTPSTAGQYRTQVCCTVGTDYMCLDKAFEAVAASSSSAPTASEVAAEVWSYSGRTLTGFGSLVSDIWGHSARALTGFGTLAQDIWNHNPRTTTDGSGGNLEEIEKTVKENRLMLEKLINKPIIQNFIEDDHTDLGAQLNQTKEVMADMYMNTQVAVSKLGVVLLSWEEMTAEEISSALVVVKDKLGQESDTGSSSTIVGQSTWLTETWGWDQASETSDQAKLLLKSLSLVERKLNGAGGWKAAYTQAKEALALAESLEQGVGSSEDARESLTLYGRFNETQLLAQAWDEKQLEADKLLKGWDAKQVLAYQADIEKLQKSVLTINKVPRGYAALQANSAVHEVEKRIKNRLLSIRGLIETNKKYLAKGDKGVLASTWLEEGSVVFKSMVTNPSKIISQDVEVKYYLPPEVKEEDILSVDSGLTVKFDTEKNNFYVEGKYTLKPSESKTLFVRVDDIWLISDEEMNSYRKQVDELSKPLAKTALFAQGVTIKSDIDVALDKIEVLQGSANTPEQKIRAWRESQIELGGVKVKMEKMKELVAQASSANGLFGFVGGAQVIAVWGMIIIFVAGFVFLALYMKMISGHKVKHVVDDDSINENVKSSGSHRKGHGTGWKIGFAVVVTAVLSAACSAVVVRNILLSEKSAVASEQKLTEGKVAGEKTEKLASEGSTDTKDQGTKINSELGIGGPVIKWLSVPGNGKVNLRDEASLESKIIKKISESGEVVVLEETDEWVQVEWEGIEGWVSSEFVGELESSN